MTNFIGYGQTYPEQEPDLGWLIQNEQVNDEALCAAILEGYRADLELLASTLLGSPVDLLDVLNRTIEWTMINRKRFSGEVTGRAWLLKRMLLECLAKAGRLSGKASLYSRCADLLYLPASLDVHSKGIFQALGNKRGLLAILAYGLSLAEDQVAYTLGSTGEQIRSDLKNLYSQLSEHQETCPQCSAKAVTPAVLMRELVAQFQPARPRFNFDQESQTNWKASVLRRTILIHKAEQARMKRIKTVAIGTFFVLMLLVVGLVERTWSKKPSSPGVLSMVSTTATPRPIRAPRYSSPLPLPVDPARSTPMPTPTVIKTPDIANIVSLANTSLARWQSLWADVQVIDYSPYGDASEPQTFRKQLWVSQPGSSRVIAGPASGYPDSSYASFNNRYYTFNFQSGQSSDNFSSDLIQDADLQKLFIPYDMFIPEGVLKYVGSGQIANRPVWILDRDQGAYIDNEYAIDQQYGVILYLQVYGGKDAKTLLSESRVASITFNPQISPAIYNPTLYLGDHFANDYSGVPEVANVQAALAAWTAPRQAAAPPQAIPSRIANLSVSHLAVINQSALNVQGASQPGLDLFGDGVYLGKLPASSSAMLACKRSPDGGKIAYTSAWNGTGGDTGLVLVDLANLQSAHTVMLNGLTAGDFAFSPDSGRLAFFGCEKAAGYCGVLILDLKTGIIARQFPLLYADYLLWSPDGRALALVGEQDSLAILAQKTSQNLSAQEVLAISQPWYFFVLNANNGDILYKQPFAWRTLSIPTDSPAGSWPVTLQVQPVGFTGCITPPLK